MNSNSVFPGTRKYKREMQALVSGDYRIVTKGTSYWGTVLNSFVVYYKGEKIKHCSTQREAKTAVEMHDAGYGTDVRFYNIPERGAK